MTSSRPYLIRAIHEWITDNGMTPYLLVKVQGLDVMVPEQFVDNGKIILNVSYMAVRDLHMENDKIYFSARFDGRSMDVYFPTDAVLAIYAKENGQGMVLDQNGIKPSSPQTPPPPRQRHSKPHLTLVK